MAPGTLQKLVLGGLLISLTIAAVVFVSVLENTRVALPLYLGVAAVGALFVRLVMAPTKRNQ
ncbi:MAG: hypothetical protein Q8S19_08520 [Bacillota bacterium]|nr:hypothetical protein [Bacillota bacterium]